MKNKLKIKKIIFNCVLSGLLVALFCVSSFAYTYDSLQVQIVDLASSASRTINIPIDENVSQIVFFYEPSDSSLYIELGVHDATTTYFITYMPSTYHCDINFSAGQTQSPPVIEIYNETGHYSASYSLDLNTNLDTIYVQLQMYNGSNAVYTIAEYQAYGVSRFNDGEAYGIAEVQTNPNNYSLWSNQDYLDYGEAEYDRGYLAGSSGSVPSDDIGYAKGYEDGLKDGKTFVGTINVMLTNMYRVFMNFINSTGIFGISLISIIVTAFIVLIVYLIFKAVRS